MKQDSPTSKKKSRSLDIVIFFMDIIGLWYTNNEKEQFIANIKLIATLLFMNIAFVTLLNGFYYSLHDLQLLSYSAPLMGVNTKEILKLFVLTWNRKKVMDLNRFVDINFLKKDNNDNETQLFNECEKKCFAFLISYILICTAVGAHFIYSPMIENIFLNVTERRLPFPVYTDMFPVWQSPYYEIIYFIEVLEIVFGGICALIFVSFFFVSIMFTAVQFKFLTLNLEQLCCDVEFKASQGDFQFQQESYKKLKIYIKQHKLLINYTNDIEELYSYVILVQTFGSMAQICFSCFQLLLATIYPIPFHQIVLSTGIFVGSIMQFYLYCFSAHEIIVESEKISQSIYFAKWFRVVNPKIHKHFTLLIQIMVHRARRPCVLTVGKFCPLNLDTFSSVMRTSMSYFTVLRQTYG